ncbi:PadR family transcriptional regulator [Streptomyces atriruber]|uniref:PadR family transcriptional regulator n=1 Tax=Streptomyces atriruber TaxID=545121 RepID=UPI00099F36C6|nr:helix-turn-helix transcriptional regulator [Streptomyces atriruber]
MAPLRLTQATIGVLNELLNATHDEPTWGLKICVRADLGSSTVYPVLDRLSKLGWVTSWNETTPHPSRPPRRFHVLTTDGRAQVQQLLAQRSLRRRLSHPIPLWGQI